MAHLKAKASPTAIGFFNINVPRESHSSGTSDISLESEETIQVKDVSSLPPLQQLLLLEKSIVQLKFGLQALTLKKTAQIAQIDDSVESLQQAIDSNTKPILFFTRTMI